jgi:hypothetical protein
MSRRPSSQQQQQQQQQQHNRMSEYPSDRGGRPNDGFRGNRNDHEFQAASDYQKQPPPSRGYDVEPPYNKGEPESPANGAAKKRSYDDYQKQQPSSRGYDIEPAYAKRRNS